MIYRKAHIKDLEQCRTLGIEAYSEYRSSLEPKYWIALKTILEDPQTVKNLYEGSTAYVCEIQNEIVGVIYYFSSGNPTDLYPKDLCYIRSLAVKPSYRKLGIGKRLTEICIDHAQSSKEQNIALHTSEMMPIAMAMYEKMGFIKKNEVERLGKKYWIYIKKLS